MARRASVSSITCRKLPRSNPRAQTSDGLPLIGRVPGLAGAYVATGHGPWGMLNAPATGSALAELVVDGAASLVDLRPFDPGRLPARVS